MGAREDGKQVKSLGLTQVYHASQIYVKYSVLAIADDLDLVEFDLAEPHELIPAVCGPNVANGARLRAHDHAGRMRAAAEIFHSFEQLAVSDPGGSEKHVVALDQLIIAKHLL